MTDLDEFSEMVHAEVEAALDAIGPAVIAKANGDLDGIPAEHPARFMESPEYVFSEVSNSILVRCLVSMAGASGKFEEGGHDDELLVSELMVEAISEEIEARLAGLDPSNLF